MEHRANERGIALILVLVILPLVAIIMTQLSFETAIGDRLADNALAHQQFNFAIAARIRQLRLRLVRDLKDDEKNAQAAGGAFDHYGDLWGPDSEGGKTATQVTKGDKENGDDVTIYTECIDELGKFNLNLLTHKDEARAARAAEVFRNLLDFYRDARFDDWEDSEYDLSDSDAKDVTDAVIKFLKAEARDGPVPVPKPEVPDPTPEMKQGVHSVRDLIFAHKYFLEKRMLESFTDIASGQTLPSLLDFVTVYGDGRVNVNTAKIQVLRAFFKEEPGQRDVAENILHERGGFLSTDEDQDERKQTIEEREEAEANEEEVEVAAYKQLNDLSKVEGMGDGVFLRRNGIDIPRDFAVRSNFYTVIVTARRGSFLRRQRVVLERHSKGTLTWATEVRTVDMGDLPEGMPGGTGPTEP